MELDPQARLGARRNRPPVSCKAVSTRELTFFVTVLSEVTVFIGLRLNVLDGLTKSNA
jgi:hypothetical protein